MSVRSILKKMRAMAVLLRLAKAVDMVHPVLMLRYEVEKVPPEQMILWRRETAAACRCETCEAYKQAVKRYDQLFQEANPDLVIELPNPSKEQER